MKQAVYNNCAKGVNGIAYVAYETKPRYSPSANQRPKACSTPRVLPPFSIIGSYWLLHMAVLSCTVIGQVDLALPYALDEYQIHNRNTAAGGDHGISI